ncbi:hypothetical protein A1O1_06853 [Capronia coronata CBS 617.96]|uniref:Uncharacterized protein n=1 Tax=Capronia coronata CBS 617.96 TaxID=1182541 RepID=W9YLT4_9EURO|nr:uncharacterized protein A1O1_06853 [Capronia coronata CBS 617.96]EXJ83234.1 hypothetical protein A1O1_06853 [Capronia coronata CBS 617.96]
MAGAGAALRRGDIKISEPLPFEGSADTSYRPRYATQSFHSSGHRPYEASWQSKIPSAQDPHIRHASDTQAYAATRGSSGPSSLPRSMSTIPAKASLDQKRSGGIRAALKRMFSSKRHRSAPADSNVFEYSNRRQLFSVAEQQTQTRAGPSPTSASPLRDAALGSHSIQQEQDPPKQGLQVLPRRGRRNTLPSLVFDDKETGLDHEGLNRFTSETSPQDSWSKGNYISDGRLNRRSRSADALSELLQREGIELSSARDRAGEIAYWRNSAIQKPVPVYSGQSIAVEAVHSAPESQSVPGVVDPMQSFEFGLEDTGKNGTNLEQRVNTLEIKLFDFEYAIAKLQGNNISKPVLPSKPFIRGSAHDILFDDHGHSATDTGSPRNPRYFHSPVAAHAITFLSSPGESPSPSIEARKAAGLQRASTATTATIRPNYASRQPATQSSEASPSSTQLSAGQVHILMALIEEEKEARQQLEAQVTELQKELDSMRTPIYATIREAYPTPSPESTHNTAGTPRSLHRTAGFQLSHAVAEISRFSGTDAETDAETELDEESEDVYATPKESRTTFESARDSLGSAVIETRI